MQPQHIPGQQLSIKIVINDTNQIGLFSKSGVSTKETWHKQRPNYIIHFIL